MMMMFSCRETVCRRNLVLLKFLLYFSVYIHYFRTDITFLWGCPRGVMVKAMD